ncbi:MAG TPA: DUF2723 domain-containing protein [Anaerolineae bacterium]|nr:DUF2723 domain-containing protein [Anaerolineae bacterium]
MGRKRWLLGCFVASAALVLYVATVAPGLTLRHWGADGGDLVAAARTLGVPHPPGFPTYIVLAWLATHLPVGSIAYRVNLLSAITGAAAIGFVGVAGFTTLPRGQSRWLPAASAALTLAFAPLVWSQAIIGEVYAPAFCFASLALLLAIEWRRHGEVELLWAFALVFGLGLGVHLTLVVVLPAVTVLLWPERRLWLRKKTLAPCVALFLAGLSAYSYLPVAASTVPPVNWGAPSTWPRFLWVVAAKPYQSLVFGLPPSHILPRLEEWAGILVHQLGWGGWLLALLGLAQLLRSDVALALCGITWFASTALLALFYDSQDSLVYLVPSMAAVALWLSQGLGCLHRWGQRQGLPARVAASTLILLLPVSSLALNWADMDLSHDRQCATYADQVLRALDPNAIVLAQGDQPTFVLWYAVHAEGQRPDVAVVNTRLLGFDWYRDNIRHTYPRVEVPELSLAHISDPQQMRELVTHNYLEHPIYALDPSDTWLEWFDLAQVHGSPVFRVRPLPKWERQP